MKVTLRQESAIAGSVRRMPPTWVGLVVAFVAALITNTAYSLEHDAAATLPPLSPRRPARCVMIRPRRGKCYVVDTVGGRPFESGSASEGGVREVEDPRPGVGKPHLPAPTLWPVGFAVGPWSALAASPTDPTHCPGPINRTR